MPNKKLSNPYAHRAVDQEAGHGQRRDGQDRERIILRFVMDTNNPVIQLCIEGARAEFEQRLEAARALYQQAWEARQDDFDACVSAHYVARFQTDPIEALRWNQIALDSANAVNDGQVKDFYPSLYLNLGQAHEKLGNQAEAQNYYNLAAGLGFPHQDFERALNSKGNLI